jgi:hypothetical protein
VDGLLLGFFLVVLLIIGGAIGLFVWLIVRRRTGPADYAKPWEPVRAAVAAGTQPQPSPGDLWGEPMLLSTGSQVLDGSGRLLAYYGPQETLLSQAGVPQLRLRVNRPHRGSATYDILHPDGTPYGSVELDRYVGTRLWLRLRDGAGTQVAALETLDKGFTFAFVDGAGHELARVRRASPKGSRTEDTLELVAPLEGSLHALILGVGLQIGRMQRTDWLRLDHDL